MVKCGEWGFWEGREGESNPWEVALWLDLGGEMEWNGMKLGGVSVIV